MLGSHETVARRPPRSAVRHRSGKCEEAIVRPRVGVGCRGGCGAQSLYHGKWRGTREKDCRQGKDEVNAHWHSVRYRR
jgi:hypothetical protein